MQTVVLTLFGIRVKSAEVHAKTLNNIKTIKQTDYDNVIVIGTDVNLIILLSKLTHLITILLSKLTHLITILS